MKNIDIMQKPASLRKRIIAKQARDSGCDATAPEREKTKIFHKHLLIQINRLAKRP